MHVLIDEWMHEKKRVGCMNKCIVIEVKLCRNNHPKCVHILMKSTERRTLFFVAMTNHMCIEDCNLSICVGNYASLTKSPRLIGILFLGRHSD